VFILHGPGHHEFGNGETSFLVSDALGREMMKLLTKEPKDSEPAKPIAHTERKVEAGRSASMTACSRSRTTNSAGAPSAFWKTNSRTSKPWFLRTPGTAGA
jgi:hypothetical protein